VAEPGSVVDGQELLTTAEVAVLLRAPTSTVRYWRHIGFGPASFRLGRRVVYRQGEVARWIEEQERTSINAG